MRLASAFLFLALTGSAVLADEAKPADPKPEVTKKKVPLRVVKILPESRQVLLFDKTQGNHVVAEVGQNVEGFVVDDIDDDEVTVSNAETGIQAILAAPAPHRAEKDRAAKKAAPKAPEDPYSEGEAAPDDSATKTVSKAPAKTTPVDPYAAPDATAPVDPYAPAEANVRVVSAPDAPTDPGITAFVDAVSPAPRAVSMNDKPALGSKPAAKGKNAKKPAKAETPEAPDSAALAAAATGSAAPAAASPTAPASPAATVIARSEVDAALADFGKLAGSFRATFTAEGLRFDAIADGTLLAKAGLKKGDVVTAVENQPLKSLDDAADLYARAGSVRSSTIQVVRAGKPLTLKIAIQ